MTTPRPTLVIRLYHNGQYADGRPNVSSVLVQDLDVGYENQDRKVACYVPPGGHIDINASSRSMLSFEQGAIKKFCQVNVLRSRMFYVPEPYATVDLPPAPEYPMGVFVWDTTLKTPTWSDGTNWVTGLAAPTGPAGGDLDGFYPNPTVMGICGHPIDGNTPANGDVLAYNSFTNKWEHVSLSFGGGPPSGPAGGDLAGLYPNPAVNGLQLDVLPAKLANGFLKRNAANLAWEEVAYGSGANTVTQGNDPRLSDTRVPKTHAPSHAGGADPLTVNTGNAAVGVTDPTHTHTVGSTVTTSSYIIGYHETFGRINADNRTVGTIAENAATATPSEQTAHLRCMNVVFPAGWVGGSITINGVGSLGQAISVVYAFPPGGGTVVGTKTFAVVTNYVNSAPAGVPGVTATITNGSVLGVPNFPIVAFIKVCIDGVADSFSTTDIVNGTFDTVGAHVGNHTLEVWYTVDVAPILAGHTHTLTSNATGVTVADSGHGHGLTG